MDYDKQSLEARRRLKGALEIRLLEDIKDKDDLSVFYTPGIAAVSRYISEHPESARELTWLNNCIALISDGSAVLGLGEIGPRAALPVMEGKCELFKKFGGVNAIPIVLDVHTPDEIVATVKSLAPSFGGINLEDIKAPECFEIEQRLIDELDIPVMHDDQHGTAIVVLAGLINAVKLTGRSLDESKVVISGAGAAGVAVAKLIHEYSKATIIAVDSTGVISRRRANLTAEKQFLASLHSDSANTLTEALVGADIFVGVSRGNLVTADNVRTMADKPIIFAMANPTPEIMPELAHEAGAVVIATGRSDYPNQINNVLVFPGIFRGALDNKVTKITTEHKVRAAEVLAAIVKQPTVDNIIPSVFDSSIVPAIADVIR